MKLPLSLACWVLLALVSSSLTGGEVISGLTNESAVTLINGVDDSFGRLGGITTARSLKPPRPVVSFSRSERMVEPWGVVPIEVYFLSNSQPDLFPDSPTQVVVRQISGERRDQLGNPLSFESWDLYFWPWQAFREVSFYDLATDATFVLETTAADMGRHSRFTARIGKPASSVTESVPARFAQKVSVQLWRADRQQTAQTVRLRTVDGTARAGIDFVALERELNFARGDQFKEFEVEILPEAKPATSFKIEYVNPDVSFPYGSSTQVEIRPWITFSSARYWLDSQNRLTYTVQLNAAADTPVSANLAVPDLDPWCGLCALHWRIHHSSRADQCDVHGRSESC